MAGHWSWIKTAVREKKATRLLQEAGPYEFNARLLFEAGHNRLWELH